MAIARRRTSDSAGTPLARTVAVGFLSAVAPASTVDIVTYTVPVAKKFLLESVTYGGENIADYFVLLNGSPIDRMRTYFGGPFTDESYQGFRECVAGQVLKVQVTNFRPSSANFEAKIIGVELDA